MLFKNLLGYKTFNNEADLNYVSCLKRKEVAIN